jgi:GntR family transcriptional regulator
LEGTLIHLNPAATTPLYLQLKLWLQEQIREGAYPPRTPLPAERQLCETLGVSRATVRQALGALEQEGWVVKQHGRGTFVAPVKVEQPAGRLSGFSENMRQAGKTPSSLLLSAELAEPSDAVTQVLALAPGDVVAILTRVRLADGEPLMVERSHLNYALTPKLLAQDLTGSLYWLLTEVYRLNLAAGEESIEIVAAEPWLARALKVTRGAPLLYTERVVRDEAGQPIEFAQRFARADKCRFRVSLAGDAAHFTLKETARA